MGEIRNSAGHQVLSRTGKGGIPGWANVCAELMAEQMG